MADDSARDPRPRGEDAVGPAPRPSARSRERLAAQLAVELGATRAAWQDASHRSHERLRAGDDAGALAALEDQQRLLRLLEQRLDRAVTAAAVEREAEQALADGEPWPEPAPAPAPAWEAPGRGGWLRTASLAGAAAVAAVAVALGALGVPTVPPVPEVAAPGAAGSQPSGEDRDGDRAVVTAEHLVARSMEADEVDWLRRVRLTMLWAGGAQPWVVAAPGDADDLRSGSGAHAAAPVAEVRDEPEAAGATRSGAGDAEPDTREPEEPAGGDADDGGGTGPPTDPDSDALEVPAPRDDADPEEDDGDAGDEAGETLLDLDPFASGEGDEHPDTGPEEDPDAEATTEPDEPDEGETDGGSGLSGTAPRSP